MPFQLSINVRCILVKTRIFFLPVTKERKEIKKIEKTRKKMCPDMSSASLKLQNWLVTCRMGGKVLAFFSQPGSVRAYCKSKKEMNFSVSTEMYRFSPAVVELFLAFPQKHDFCFITLQSAPDDVPTR
jgi:hypothetical protein